MRSLLYLMAVWGLLCLAPSATAQFTPTPPLPANIEMLLAKDSTLRVHVTEWLVTGNKKTKSYIIEREMLIRKGDTLELKNLHSLLDESRRLVYNTALFTSVDITPVLLENQQLSIVVSVQEKWYIYPLPHLQLADRNFNEWWNTYNADFSRLIYGVRFMHYNTGGRRDPLTIMVNSGYTRNISVLYSSPYSNRTLTEGFSIQASYSDNRETIVSTSDNNKLQLFKTDNFSRKNFFFGANYMRRNGFYFRHQIGAGINYTEVDDSVVLLNPRFFNTNKTGMLYPDFSYKLQFLKVDNINYPLDGLSFTAGILKRGFGFTGGMNMTALDFTVNRYKPHGNNWYSAFTVAGQLKAPFRLSYLNNRAFGYKEYYIRGLEYYAIDGPVSALGKYTLKKKILQFNVPVPFKNVIANRVPFQIFAKVYGDAGYSYNVPETETRLNNRFLYSSGFGLDILSLYDMSLRLEYSFNQLGENGLFLHITGAF